VPISIEPRMLALALAEANAQRAALPEPIVAAAIFADDVFAPSAAETRTTAPPCRSRRLTPKQLVPGGILLGPAALLIVWELASRLGFLSPHLLAAPSKAAVTGFQLIANGTLGEQFLASAQRAYLGLIIGVAIGVVFALAAGLSRIGEATIDGTVQIKRAIPTLALIPFGILWLGIGDLMKVAIVALSVFIPVYVNVHAALESIDIKYVELAHTLGLTRLEFTRRVVIPGVLHRAEARRYDLLGVAHSP
jgi:sulfonate transport system permease protein